MAEALVEKHHEESPESWFSLSNFLGFFGISFASKPEKKKVEVHKEEKIELASQHEEKGQQLVYVFPKIPEKHIDPQFLAYAASVIALNIKFAASMFFLFAEQIAEKWETIAISVMKKHRVKVDSIDKIKDILPKLKSSYLSEIVSTIAESKCSERELKSFLEFCNSQDLEEKFDLRLIESMLIDHPPKSPGGTDPNHYYYNTKMPDFFKSFNMIVSRHIIHKFEELFRGDIQQNLKEELKLLKTACRLGACHGLIYTRILLEEIIKSGHSALLTKELSDMIAETATAALKIYRDYPVVGSIEAIRILYSLAVIFPDLKINALESISKIAQEGRQFQKQNGFKEVPQEYSYYGQNSVEYQNKKFFEELFNFGIASKFSPEETNIFLAGISKGDLTAWDIAQAYAELELEQLSQKSQASKQEAAVTPSLRM